MGNAIRSFTTGYVENYRDKLEYIVDFMYDNNDEVLSEERSRNVLCDILGKEGFEIKKDISDIKNSFKASFGSGSPVVAYICEYSSPQNSVSSCNKNFSAAINLGAAVGLKRAVNEIGGSVLVYGCPACEKSFHKVKMFNNGEFKGVDIVICGHASDKTCESGTSLGSTVIDFSFSGSEFSSPASFKDGTNALNPCIMLFNLIERIKAKYPSTIFINGIIQDGGNNINIVPGSSKSSFIVKGTDRNQIEGVIREMIECAEFSARFYDCNLVFNYPENQLETLKTHGELSKIACHNLKESGIIDIHGPVTVPNGTDLGNISLSIPTIHPCIGICEDENNYEASKFSEYTKSIFAKDNMIKAACALALTGVDIIQKPEILKNNSEKPTITNRPAISVR